MRSKTGDRAVQKRKKKLATQKTINERYIANTRKMGSMKKSKGGKIMKAMGGKMMKSKGYSKGGARMMKAMGGKMASKGGTRMMRAMKGKMAKGYSKGGTRMMMKAMGGKMAKGYAKGGAKMIRAQKGKEIKRPKNMISNVRNMKKNPMTRRQLQLSGAKGMYGSATKLANAINKLPKAGKLALIGGLTAGTISLIKELKPKAEKAGKQFTKQGFGKNFKRMLDEQYPKKKKKK